MNNCKGCAYKRGTECKVMNYQFEGCWAYANSEEAAKRERAIINYTGEKSMKKA